MGQIGVLDTTIASYATNSDWSFHDLFGSLLPDRILDVFCNDAAYAIWRKKGGEMPETDDILAIKVPVPLGGGMKPENFTVEDTFSFYETTAPIYKKAHAQARRS